MNFEESFPLSKLSSQLREVSRIADSGCLGHSMPPIPASSMGYNDIPYPLLPQEAAQDPQKAYCLNLLFLVLESWFFSLPPPLL